MLNVSQLLGLLGWAQKREAFHWDTAGGTSSGATISYSNEDRTATIGGSSLYATAYAPVPVSAKSYFELTFQSAGTYGNVGLAVSKHTGFAQDGAAPFLEQRSIASYWNDSVGSIGTWTAYAGYRTNPGGSASMVAWNDGVARTYGFAVDTIAGKFWVTLDGATWMGGGNPAAGTGPTVSGIAAPIYLLGSNIYNGGGIYTIGNGEALLYPVPGGFDPIG